ncbi:kinase-like domain-containing protein [Mycena belliarum]|uniref:Kinase-like domain-containing protein n=1 Tax=Mycena belliarum TaxID=1033014 RepID=A0AAD6XKE8_9AGAR|nr:kinase-like domain-containing protein [Mycena belliae]
MSARNDLSTIAGAQTYLASTPFASTRLTLLSGVHCNFTYRLHLATPYKGRTTLVMKHAQPYISLSATEKVYAMERQTFEARALQKIREALDCGPGAATVPVVHLFDEDAHVLIIEDCGEQSCNLKQLFLTAAPTPAVARGIGLALGKFLGRLHAWGATDPTVIAAFSGNEQAKRITAWITYERLVPMLTTDELPEVALLPTPITERDLAAIRSLVDKRIPEIYAARGALTMGDFWTGNVVIGPDPASADPAVHVIDWELVKPGVPALDLGQFCAEMQTLALFRPQAAEATAALIEAFLAEYRANCGTLAQRAASIATQHMGAHLVVITPTVGWGPPEECVKAVELGLTYLLEGDSDNWVRENSVFRQLI